jgi:hypothetical protein
MTDAQLLINLIREFLCDMESGNVAADDCIAMIRETLDEAESKM